MIVYHADKTGFLRDVATGNIDEVILSSLRRATGRGAGASEVRSWMESLTHMHVVLADDTIPADSGVSIELQIPQTEEHSRNASTIWDYKKVLKEDPERPRAEGRRTVLV